MSIAAVINLSGRSLSICFYRNHFYAKHEYVLSNVGIFMKIRY